jgi:hypothetical protein
MNNFLIPGGRRAGCLAGFVYGQKGRKSQHTVLKVSPFGQMPQHTVLSVSPGGYMSQHTVLDVSPFGYMSQYTVLDVLPGDKRSQHTVSGFSPSEKHCVFMFCNIFACYKCLVHIPVVKFKTKV